MAQVLCDVSEGLRTSEATVKLLTYEGRPEFLPVDRGLLSEDNGKHYLSVGLIHVSQEKKAALVSLPVEADSGAHRVWVKLDHLLEIWNISPLKIRLKRGMPICQIIFEEVHGIPEGRYAGQYAIQGPGH